jgi:protein-tyrosine-phosphatase
MAPPGVRVLSAGLTRTTVNAEVVRALAEINLDASRQRSKTIEDLAGEKIDEVFVLCEEALLPSARRFPEAAIRLWSMPDPVAQPDPSLVPPAVRRARDELAERLREFWGDGRCR